jgi:hypothetical protein
VNLLPELNLGVVVLTNQEDTAPMMAITLRILDAYVGAPPTDWVAMLHSLNERKDQARKAEDTALRSITSGGSLQPPQQYVGIYRDAWRGEVSIAIGEGKLRLKFSHTKRLEGGLTPAGPDRFLVRWADRSLHADAYVLFSRGFDGNVAGFTMHAVSPSTDFSYDFQDLDFRRQFD